MIEPRITYYRNGNKLCEEYLLNGKYHNTNGAAHIYYYLNGNKQIEHYYLYGKCHNSNGPACIYYNENNEIIEEQYWFNNIRFNNKEDMDKYIILYNLT